ncbi:MAG: FAD:protein FMN transferase, partial [Gaiellaceae bacterium]
MIERRSFRAMGTEIELLVEAEGAGQALAAAEAEFHRLESLLSRFREDSQLSRLNRAGNLDAGPDLCRVVELALAARERSGGRFDPTVHDALVAAGYDRSFEQVEPDGAAAGRPAAAAGGDVRLTPGRI